MADGVDYDGFFGTLDLNLPLPPKEGGGGQRGRSYSSVDFIEITRDFTLTNPAIWTELGLLSGQTSVAGAGSSGRVRPAHRGLYRRPADNGTL